jgi:hypothetical protein
MKPSRFNSHTKSHRLFSNLIENFYNRILIYLIINCYRIIILSKCYKIICLTNIIFQKKINKFCKLYNKFKEVIQTEWKLIQILEFMIRIVSIKRLKKII